MILHDSVPPPLSRSRPRTTWLCLIPTWTSSLSLSRLNMARCRRHALLRAGKHKKAKIPLDIAWIRLLQWDYWESNAIIIELQDLDNPLKDVHHLTVHSVSSLTFVHYRCSLTVHCTKARAPTCLKTFFVSFRAFLLLVSSALNKVARRRLLFLSHPESLIESRLDLHMQHDMQHDRIRFV